MATLRDWALDLLDRNATELSPESLSRKRRLLDIGEQALVAQDMITFGLKRHALSRADLETAREFAASGVFGKATAWLIDQIDQEWARIAA